jgi:hypothetical protein
VFVAPPDPSHTSDYRDYRVILFKELLLRLRLAMKGHSERSEAMKEKETIAGKYLL